MILSNRNKNAIIILRKSHASGKFHLEEQNYWSKIIVDKSVNK